MTVYVYMLHSALFVICYMWNLKTFCLSYLHSIELVINGKIFIVNSIIV